MKVEIKNVSKVYGNGFKALDDVTLDIGNGLFGLLGPNGAGKSSLMRILVTLQEHSTGSILIDGKDIIKDRKYVRNLIGYLPQDFTFFTKLKTWEFLDYSARLGGLSRKERKVRVDEMLEQVGLLDVREKLANKLSGGMKRRLGIAQSLIARPKLVVVDEPTTGLDPEERIRFRNVLADIGEQDVTVILSTHIKHGNIFASAGDITNNMC
ncbi:MAG: ATP-binding cassette domain-containing protein, partial [Bacteroidota bacterium]